MLKRIVRLSLRFRGITVVLACLLTAYGVYVAQRAKLDVFPEFAPPRIVVQTEAAGLSAEEVETLVTRPIENGLNGTPSLDVVYSQSIQGLSVVTAVFRDDADIFRVRQLVGERLTEITDELPDGVGSPTMGPLTSSTSLTSVIGLVSADRTPMELRSFADWTVRPALLGVGGVANVEVFGGEVRQLQVRIRPDRLAALGLSMNDVLSAAKEATGVRGAGFIENENQRIVVRTKGQALTPEELGEAVVETREGSTVRLRDVAAVVEGGEPKLGDAQIMGEPGVVMMVHSQYGANTLEVTRSVEARLADLGPLLAARKITLHPRLFRPASFVEDSIHNIDRSLLIGGAMVVLVLFFFLANLRSAFIAFVTIPLSLLAALIVLDWRGVSLNTITLGGFAISIGVVVDDAIIGLENVWRRLRENRALPQPRRISSVVLDATLEVRSPIVYATLIVAAVFWPVLMMSGVNGRMFAPLAEAFILATLASLVVAVTLTPALCLLVLPRARMTEPFYVSWLKRGHRRALMAVFRRPWVVMVAALAICATAVIALPFLGGEFLPEFKEGHYILRMMAAPGTSLPASLSVGTAITRELLKDSRIRSVSQEVGRAELGEDTMGPEFSEFHIDLKPVSGSEMEEVKDNVRATLASFPGVTYAVTPFLEERIEEVLSGGQGEIVVNVLGDDLDAIGRTSQEIGEIMRSIPGATDVFVDAQSGVPEIAVNLRRDRLRQLGFEATEVLDAIQTAYQGTVAAQVYDNDRVFEVAVILEPERRTAPESVGQLLLRNAAGLCVPLSQLADVESTSGRYVVIHENTRRRQQVTCNAEGQDLASFMRTLKRAIETRVSLPPGVSVSYSGAAEASGKARNELLFHSGVAAAVIILLLSIVLENSRNMLLVLANLPFALAGGVWVVFMTGGDLSIGSLVGFISLFGISMRNSILMISHYEHLVAEEGAAWGLDTAIRGATERLLPILMTALVVVLGLLPLALGAGEAGREIEGPMAVVILGGLVTSTVLNLFVLPTLALRYGRFRARATLDL